MSDLTNEFSWSWSRHRTFGECTRKYWLNHYGSWGGWDTDTAAPDVREAYIQKNLNNRPLWIGSVVHEAVEWVVREMRFGRYHDPKRVVERFERHARRQLDDSQRGLYRVNPKKFPGFGAHYYNEASDPDDWQEAVSDIGALIGNVFDNPVFLRLAQVPDRIRESEKLMRVRIDDVPVWVSLDVLVEDGQGGFVVVDWKTGRHHDSSRIEGQLGVYAAYVMSRYFNVNPTSEGPKPVDKLKTMYANLRKGTQEVFTIGEEGLERTLNTIRDSSTSMLERLIDPPNNTAREQDFPKLPEGDPVCATCFYRRSCGRE